MKLEKHIHFVYLIQARQITLIGDLITGAIV
jgi:hypothetical protein